MRASDLFLDGLPTGSGSDAYEVQEEIGHGTFSEVHRARHKTTGDLVALKYVPFSNAGERPLVVQRELAALKTLEGLANVVELKGTCEEDYGICLVMQLCVSDLGSVLSKQAGRPLPPPVAKSIMLQLLQALDACHSKNIMHRDVSPYNVLFDEKGGVRLSDFGQARQQHAPTTDVDSASLSAAGTTLSPIVGTRWYRAPELLFGAVQYSSTIDMWSAGCIFAELLTGKPLFPGSSDIDQICLIRDVLGSPSPEIWPGIESLPDWGKLIFPPKDPVAWSEALKSAAAENHIDTAAIGLLSGLLRYDSFTRLTASQALQDTYFQEGTQCADDATVLATISALI